MALDWKQEISLSTITGLFGGNKKDKGTGSSAYPTKTTMNLYQVEREGTDVRKVVVVGALLFVAVALFTKFGVLDQLERMNAKEAELAQQQALAQAVNSSMADYQSVKEIYDGYMVRYGEGSSDVIAILDMVESHVMPRATVSGIQYEEGVLTLTLYNATLDTLGSLAKDLEGQPLVKTANVTTAAMQSSDGQNNISTLVLTLNESQSEAN